MQKTGVIEIISLICPLTLWGQCPLSYILNSLRATPLGLGASVAETHWPQHPLFSAEAGSIIHLQSQLTLFTWGVNEICSRN